MTNFKPEDQQARGCSFETTMSNDTLNIVFVLLKIVLLFGTSNLCQGIALFYADQRLNNRT